MIRRRQEKEITKRNIIIAILILLLTYILNCSVTYTITCTNGEQIEVSQKIIHYILGLD